MHMKVMGVIICKKSFFYAKCSIQRNKTTTLYMYTIEIINPITYIVSKYTVYKAVANYIIFAVKLILDARNGKPFFGKNYF